MNMQSSMSQAKPLVSNTQSLYNMKYEIASELGVNIPNQSDWGNITSRDCGRVGGNITRRLVELGKQHLQ